MEYSYLLIDLGALIVPLIFSFHPKLRFDKVWKAFWPACLLAGGIFIVWDILYTELGVWGFNPDYLSGIYFFNLPLEEVLFFICIPYACVYTYHCFEVLTKDYLKNHNKLISGILVAILLIIGLLNVGKLYTGATFISTAIFIAVLQFLKKADYMGRFYFTYLIILIPFFIVNGMLTGTGFDSPIVWYDDSQNLGLRMLTIPVEDTFYGMLLILLNISLFEYFKLRFKVSVN